MVHWAFLNYKTPLDRQHFIYLFHYVSFAFIEKEQTRVKIGFILNIPTFALGEILIPNPRYGFSSIG